MEPHPHPFLFIPLPHRAVLWGLLQILPLEHTQDVILSLQQSSQQQVPGSPAAQRAASRVYSIAQFPFSL